MPYLLRLLGKRRDHVRMGVPERVDGNAGSEIKVALTLGRVEPSALAPLEGEVDACVSGQKMRGHNPFPRRLLSAPDLYWKLMTTFRDHARAEKKCAASPGGTFFILLQALVIASPPFRRAGGGGSPSDSNSPQVLILKETVGSCDLGVANACTRVTPYCSVLV